MTATLQQPVAEAQRSTTPAKYPQCDLVSTESETDLLLDQVDLGKGLDEDEQIPQRISLKERFADGICWWNVGWMAIVHVGGIAALWHFSWVGLFAFAVLYCATLCIGITLGYHRLLSHNSLRVPKWLNYLCSTMGVLSAQGSPLYWVASHRKHHAHSDEPDDPHSPLDGFWWSHILWIKPKISNEKYTAMFKRWAPDLYKDPVQRFFVWSFPLFTIALGVALYFIGELTMGLGWSLVLWGVFFRIMVVYHVTWCVNSATHRWGYRNYETKDHSRNLWWVAILTFGEGWHNNHHAHQRLALHGHRWWEVDVTGLVIRALRRVGLATKVQDQLPEEGAV